MLRLKKRIEELEREKLPVSLEQSILPTSTSTPRSADSPDETHEDYLESNAMTGFVKTTNEMPSQHYIDSNATSFMNLIKSLVDQDVTFPESQGSQASANSPLKRLSSRKAPARRPLPAYVLPSRQQADHLLVVYRDLVATLYPFLDLDDIEVLYQRLWTGEDLGEDGLTFLCLINVIFSIACNLDSSTPPQERIVNAKVFYTRAKELLQFDIIQQRSLLTVQCFLLLGQYLQSTNDPQQCWIYVGFAIRIAQSLSLDIPMTSATEPLQKRETFRKVWHGCVLMDQTLSMTFGRSAMITSQASTSVPLPIPHLDSPTCDCSLECLSRSSTTEYHFFVETLKLYNLMNETLTTMYSSDANGATSEDPNVVYFGHLGANSVGSLLEIDHKLSCWHRDLPIHLRQNAASNGSPIHQRQKNVLFLRYSHVKILLFRPILARYCSQGATQDDSLIDLQDCLTANIALQFSVACIKAAFGAIDCFAAALYGREISSIDDTLPAWWYSIFYVYTAATVLVAARLKASLLEEVTEQAVSNAWNTAMTILDQYQAFSKLAKRCSTALTLLLNQVLQQGQIRDRGRLGTRPGTLSSPLFDPGTARTQTHFDGSAIDFTGIHTQDWTVNSSDFSGSGRQDSSLEDVVRHFNTAGIHVDIFGDMSWLTSMPSQLY